MSTDLINDGKLMSNNFDYYLLQKSSGSSVVECLTRDRRAAGSCLTGVTALLSLSKTHLSYLSTGSTLGKTRPCLTERLLMGLKESNQNKKVAKRNK